MTEPKVVITGAEETAAAFAKLQASVVNDLQPAQAVASLTAQGASNRAPIITGELASGYTVEDRFVINPVSYASFVEYGTVHMDAQFPIQQTIDAIAPEAEKIYLEWVAQKASEAGFGTTGG